MFRASAPPPAGSDSVCAAIIWSSGPCSGAERSRSASFPAVEIGFHRREIIILPAAVLVTGLSVGHAFVGQRKACSRLGRLEVDDDRRIRVVRLEFARAPGLHDALAGDEF